MKNKLAHLLYYAGLTPLFFGISRWLYGRRHIRVVNYHDTQNRHNGLFEAQLRFYKRRYEDVTLADLQAFLRDGTWTKKKPGLIICFDDGLRSNHDHALPLLKKWGFTGWFCVPAGFVACAAADQQAFAAEHRINACQPYADGRIALSWDEVTALQAAGHVMVNHTLTHHRMKPEDRPDVLRTELQESNRLFAEKTGRAPEVFCWVGGETEAYTQAAFRQIREGFAYSFMTNTRPVFATTNPYFLDRTNIESFNAVPLVWFQLSGLMDLLYFRKRRLRK